MRRKRLPEASDKVRGRSGEVVELTLKPGTGSPENERQRASPAGFDPSAPSAKDTSALVYELSQRLTAVVNSLGAARRMFAADDQVDLRTAQQVVDEAAEQARLATEAIHQYRREPFRHAGDVRTKAITMRESQSGKVERSGE
jgi:hypothetical protein